MTTLSIVVVCRNFARFVEACLDSVFTADQPCELVFADNGSKDDSLAIATRKLADAPAHITTKIVTLSPERPLCPFFNAAVRASTGDIVKLISADDMLGPNFFSTYRQMVAQSGPSVAVWLAGSVMIDDDGKYLKQSYGTPEKQFGGVDDGPIALLAERAVLHSRYAPAYTTPSAFYRRRVYDQLGGYNERFRFEDRPFFFDVLNHGWSVAVYPFNNTYYRLHGTGISANAAWMAGARVPILFDHLLRSSWRNKPLALYELGRNLRVVGRDRFRAWRSSSR